MREIKFRVWDGSHLFEVEEMYQNPHGHWVVVGRTNDLVNPELMQFTGLKDKNGKEIYEGDIVKDMWGYQETVRLEPFTFSDHEDSCAGFDFYLQTHTLEDFNKVEVIGNIYENPDLLVQPTK